MPRKITRKAAAKSIKPSASNGVRGFFSQIKWGESYASLFLGVAVVVVAFVLIFSFLQSKSSSRKAAESTSTISNEEVVNLTMPKSYTVKSGDYLWSIAEKMYGSGYNWVDIASANKLTNPNVVSVGTVLVIPDVKPRIITIQNNQAIQPNPITGTSYTVVKGDYLWSIAVRAYGDGYKWTEIAKANNLANPDLIFSGNVLIIPR